MSEKVQIPTPMARPSFFPGLLVDYRDFNRLSQQADRTVSLLCQYLFKGGGIVVDALNEFEIVPLEGLTVRVRPGIVILPNGQAVCLNEDRLLDLTSYRSLDSSEPLIVSLGHEVRGADRYVDEADPSVQGFKTELIVPEFRFSNGKVPDGALELFRVMLAEETLGLRLPSILEGWSDKLKGKNAAEATIDLRFRSRIVPQTFVPLSTEQSIHLRTALYAIEACLRKIERLYLVPDTLHSMEYLTQAHAELLSRPFQPSKVSFLVCEFAERFCRYFELLSRKLGSRRSQFDEPSLLSIIKLLEPLRVREVVPSLPRLDALVEVSARLETFVGFALENYQLISVLEEAILDMRHRPEDFPSVVILGGHSFERVESLTPESPEKFHLAATASHVRTTTARYREGGRQVLKGLFLKRGVITVNVQIPHADRVACVFLHQYVRRAGSVARYEMNGKTLEVDKVEVVDDSNTWINRGLVVPAEYLVQGTNHFRITVEHADLDFGFFDCLVYQPQSAEMAV